MNTEQNYVEWLNDAIRRSGRKKDWLADQMGVCRTTFWKKCKKGEFGKFEKEEIEKLLGLKK